MFESIKNQEIPDSCSYKGCLTFSICLDKEYKNSLFDLEEMLQIEALEGFSIISVFGQGFDQELDEWEWLLTKSFQKFFIFFKHVKMMKIYR